MAKPNAPLDYPLSGNENARMGIRVVLIDDKSWQRFHEICPKSLISSEHRGPVARGASESQIAANAGQR